MQDQKIKAALEKYRSCTGAGHGLQALLGKAVLENLREFLVAELEEEIPSSIAEAKKAYEQYKSNCVDYSMGMQPRPDITPKPDGWEVARRLAKKVPPAQTGLPEYTGKYFTTFDDTPVVLTVEETYMTVAYDEGSTDPVYTNDSDRFGLCLPVESLEQSE